MHAKRAPLLARHLPLSLRLTPAFSCSSCNGVLRSIHAAAQTTPDSDVIANKSPTNRVPRSHWSNDKNCREFFDSIAVELGIKEVSDWYHVTRTAIEQRGGYGLFRRPDIKTLPQALAAAYPEVQWEPSRFAEEGVSPRNYWKNKDNLLQALDRAEIKLGINQPEDWYSVAKVDLQALGFPARPSLVQIAELLAEKYPTYKWEKLYMRGKFRQQKQLQRTVTSLFPDVELNVNVRKDADIINPATGEYLELDLYLPTHKLAFEFNETHHYTSVGYSYEPLGNYKERDRTKRELVQSKGITLVIIPCWWDGKKESLAATIKLARPDLLQDVEVGNAKPVSEEPPEGFLVKNTPHVEGVGEPTNACFFTLSNIDPTNWWVFEKYDGLRGFWNPITKAFYSRSGSKFSFPQHVIETMPDDIFLDGEIWFGKENFQEAMKIGHRMADHKIDWPKFKFMVFDIPNHTGTYQQRYNELVEKIGSKTWKHIEVAPKVVCRGVNHLESFFQDVVDEGGEGVILRDPGAPLQPGRSPGYLKHKKFRDDEARVVANVGALQWECELPNGVRFSATAGTQEFSRRWNPKPGDIVSFKHHGFLAATKKPKLPTIYRVRTDLTWENVVNNWREQKPLRSAPLTNWNKKRKKAKGYWKDIKRRQQFLIKLAEEMGFDPMVPANWKKITRGQIKSKGGSFMVHYSTVREALTDTFPELDWKSQKVKQTQRKNEKNPINYWKDPKNCRAYFDELAHERGFDPLIAENWYSVLPSLSSVPYAIVISSHQGGLRNALHRAYPETKFWKWLTSLERPLRWSPYKQIENVRTFFDELAKEQGIDPTSPEAWYAITRSQISAKQGGATICKQHGGFKQALRAAYPELRFTQWEQETSDASSSFDLVSQDQQAPPFSPLRLF